MTALIISAIIISLVCLLFVIYLSFHLMFLLGDIKKSADANIRFIGELKEIKQSLSLLSLDVVRVCECLKFELAKYAHNPPNFIDPDTKTQDVEKEPYDNLQV